MPKTACIVRYGAFGDAVFITPVIRALKRDGYHVTLNCTEKTYDVLKHDPNIDNFHVQKTGDVPVEKLQEYWAEQAKKYDRYINLSGSIEGQLLVHPGQPEYGWSKAALHEKCNFNYMDHTMKVAGYPDLKGELPSLHFKKQEEDWALQIREEHKGKFLVLCSLTGSSIHKTYPWMSDVLHALVNGAPEAVVILVGEGGCKGIVEPHERIYDRCGDFGIRKSFILTKVVDLVISTETSVAVAASCFSTPKVVLLSHASEENLTKYWINCYPVYESKVRCYPCHKLHYDKASCPLDSTLQLPVCAVLLDPKKVLEPIDQVYSSWLNFRSVVAQVTNIKRG